MRYLKMLGLAAVAAMALMAISGAGTASASVLCTTDVESGCGLWDYPSHTTIDFSDEETIVFETTSGTVLDTCKGGTTHGTSGNTGASTETVAWPLDEVTWVECTKTTDTLKNGEIQIHWISNTTNGTLVGKNTEWTINTIFGSCVYGFGSGTDLGTLKGGSPAVIEVNAIVPKVSGSALCPSDARWTTKSRLTSPHAIHVATN